MKLPALVPSRLIHALGQALQRLRAALARWAPPPAPARMPIPIRAEQRPPDALDQHTQGKH